MVRKNNLKRLRTDGETSAGPIRIDGHPGVIIADKKQQAHFESLMCKPILPTRFLNAELLTHLGLSDAVKALLVGIGFSRLFNMCEFSYKSLTLEFLSSFHFDEKAGISSFRLLNKNVKLKTSEFATLMGIAYHSKDDTAPPSYFDVSTMWKCMTGITTGQGSNFPLSQVEHPALKIVMRLIAGTFFGRKEPSKLNTTEIQVLGAYLNIWSEKPFRLHIAHLVLQHFQKAASGGLSTIEIGGMVTFLAKRKFKWDESGYDKSTETVPQLDSSYLGSKNRWFKRVNDQNRWFLGSKRWIVLPHRDLPTIAPCKEVVDHIRPAKSSFVLPTPLVVHELATCSTPVVEGTESTVPSLSTRPNHPDYKDPPSYMSFIDQTFLFRQKLNHDVDMRLYFGKMYDGAIKSGQISSTGPHPSFYGGPNGEEGFFPNFVMEQAGLNPSTYDFNHHRSYGGFGAQFLGGGSRGGTVGSNQQDEVGTSGQHDDDAPHDD